MTTHINAALRVYLYPFWFTLIILLAWSNSTHASSVNVAYDNAYPPYMFGNISEVEGLYPMLVERILSQSETKPVHTGLPWKRALQNGLSGQAVVAGVHPNQYRRDHFVFSDPILTEKMVIFVRKGEAFPFNSPKDLAKKSVGIVRGYTYGDEVDSMIERRQINAYRSKDFMANFGKLTLGRIDCMLTEYYSAWVFIRANGLEDKVEQLSVPAYVANGYLVAAKGSALEGVIPEFNRHMARSKQTGEFDIWLDEFLQQPVIAEAR